MTSVTAVAAKNTDQSDRPESISTKRKRPEGLESQHQNLYEPIEIQVNGSPNGDDDRWEGSTIASDSPQLESMTSKGLMADVDWDVDVSNLSDAYSDLRQQH